MIKHLLFDMGGVVFTQTTDRARERFRAIGLDPDYYMGEYGQKDFFLDVETGAITAEEFVEKVAEVRGRNNLTWHDLQQCWLGFFDGVSDRVAFNLDYLHQDYHLCLLSNTNPFIMQFTNSEAFTRHGRPITDFFDQLFLSYEMGVCKPHADIFLKALSMGQMKAEECLFIDDSRKNIEAAEKLGIHTLYVPTNSDWWEPLQEVLKAKGSASYSNKNC